ncbi:ABC-type nitrate/sulfonate/bicarbonate transport system ATPase subunit [Bacillus pakistanensis]|uniref:ABC-type nitrate/sulfonate/bicarbonate transport system ATPase subunit n=1 Tax=Rossellomorea pakistanensis TaxID=992288 RepID=A0ABS2NC02_9BACI|nr:ATP-binding cassette domain-containing protein [Bacillus pakistanensis]MBM7585355.1 ABC-type nitrate/sulfonate/bicarbonate transport system ATPase subunit [Bacillus pakistanensis]
MLTIENLCFKRDRQVIFHQFNLQLMDHQVTCFLGSSGIGKTTLLKLIAGLLEPMEGQLPRSSESLGYVFQEHRLKPNLTVFDNIAWVMKPAIHKERINQLLKIAGLTHAKNYYPHELSGGMKQRASILRALVNKPDLILMDEPFQALDSQLKKEMLQFIQTLWSECKPTILLVTHDLEEAVFLGHRIIVLGNTPAQIIGDFTRDSYHTFTHDIHLKIEKLLEKEMEDFRGNTELASSDCL